ncbi:MAG TPA: nucleotide exchange factor GrpE [Gemmatimonadales bacterium]|jgi:molecular chaperone GrpE
MSRKHHPHQHKPANPEADHKSAEVEALQDEIARIEVEEEGAAAPAAPVSPIAEAADETADRLSREVMEWKDRALRSAADFENFRKRAIKERDEANGRGQAHAFSRIIDVIDDLARVANLDPAVTTGEALHEGMLAIERKFMKTLETAGLERIDPTGQPFDPNTMEAVASMPAPGAEADHTVGAVYQHGYRYKGQLLRPARVAVLQWSGIAPAAGDGASA